MSKIESLLQKAWNNYNFIKNDDNSSSFNEEFGKVMKEYAEHYAAKCLEIAESHIFEEVYCAEIYPTEIKLPDHD